MSLKKVIQSLMLVLATSYLSLHPWLTSNHQIGFLSATLANMPSPPACFITILTFVSRLLCKLPRFFLEDRDVSFPAFAGIPAFIKFKFPHFYFQPILEAFSPQIDTLFQAFQIFFPFRSTYIPGDNTK